VGTTTDADKDTCLAYTGRQCDFTQTNFTKCQVVGNEGFTYNIFQEQTVNNSILKGLFHEIF
jgi:hypothetical protein